MLLKIDQCKLDTDYELQFVDDEEGIWLPFQFIYFAEDWFIIKYHYTSDSSHDLPKSYEIAELENMNIRDLHSTIAKEAWIQEASFLIEKHNDQLALEIIYDKLKDGTLDMPL